MNTYLFQHGFRDGVVGNGPMAPPEGSNADLMTYACGYDCGKEARNTMLELIEEFRERNRLQ